MNELEKYNVNIIIVLEESDHETIESIKNFNCRLLFQKSKGYGDALIQGIKSVNTEFFCIFNADGSFKPDELKNMLDLSKNQNYDLFLEVDMKKILVVRIIQLLHLLVIKFFH